MKFLLVVRILFYLGICLVFFATTCNAKPRTTVKNILKRVENPRQGTKTILALPYAFSSESMGLTLGVGGGMKGYGQDQLLFGATAFASFEDAVGLFLGMWDYRPSFADRFFFSASGMVSHFPNQRAYTRLFFPPDIPRAGSNDSDADQFTEDSGFDNWTDFRIDFVLPIGSGRKDPLQKYRIKNGLLVSDPVGGDTWNPLKGGVTNLMLRQNNRYRSFELDQGDVDATMHPFELAVSYNNTDFPTNPSRGSSQYLSITQDFGWLESPDEWTFVEFEASKYFSVGESKWARQRIVALNFWTGDAVTWQEDTLENGKTVVSHRPPFYDGANLGGYYRMRGYPKNRFNDRSVIYTAAEYRYTLKWNPIANVSWLRFLQSDWIQLVGFIEGGRVANEYDLETLLKDWKWDGGVGLRFLFAGVLVRFDVGISEEATSAWVMFGQPF